MIQIAILAVDTVGAVIKDSFTQKIKFVELNADLLWLKEKTSYEKELWESSVHPKKAVDELSKFMNDYATRERTSRKLNTYSVWRFACFQPSFDKRFFLEWMERLCVEFVPRDFGKTLNVNQRVRWHFVENPHLNEPNIFTLEEMVKYFHIKSVFPLNDANNRALATFEIWKAIRGKSK